MKKYCLSNKDYGIIYEKAVREFSNQSLNPQTDLDHVLTFCIVESFLNFINQRKLLAKDGHIYETEKE